MQLHFLSFILDIVAWTIAAMLITKWVLSHKKRAKKDRTRMYGTILSSALIGGFLAQLTIGSPDIGISLINLFVAIFAVFVAIFLAFPSYATLVKDSFKQASVVSLKTLRIGLQSFKSK